MESAFCGSVACGILKHFSQEYSAKINVRYRDSRHPFSLERLNFTLWTLQVVLLCLIVLAVSLWVDTSGCTAVSDSSGRTVASVTQRFLTIDADHSAF